MQGAGERLRGLVDWASSGNDRRFFLAVFLPVAAIYLATTSWGIDVNIDVMTNTYTAHSLGTSGSPVVTGYEVPESHRTYISWLTPVEDGYISSYPPGAALLAAPLYAVIDRDLNRGTLYRDAAEVSHLEPIPVSYPDVWPGSVVAALSSAAAIGFLGLTFRLIGSPQSALIGAYVAAFGTSVWSVAADGLWQHGPSLMWLALGIYLSNKERWWGAGLAFGATILTRQLTGVVAAVIGIGLAIRRRSLRPMVGIGVASSLGLGLLSLWNGAFLGTAAPWGIRSSQASGLVSSEWVGVRFSGDVGGGIGLFENQLRGAFDPTHGFAVLSPLFVVCAFFLIKAWKEAGPANRWAAVGGLLYYITQHRITIYAHFGYLGYRYPLEALMASAPLWFLAYRHAYRWSRLVPPAAIAASVLAHAAFAIVG